MSTTDAPARDRLLETFLDLVRIDSPSGSEAACAAYCAEALSRAGCTVRFDDAGARTGSDTGNLIAELAGTAGGTLVLSAHMDCVEPCRGVQPLITDGVVHTNGETILGADDKVGLAAAIECVRELAEGGGTYPTIRCVFTVQEEVGLTGAKALESQACHGDVCLVLDADGTPGGIVIGAPTHMTFVARFIGKAAHAGVAPETGISAVNIAADAIGRMPTGRLDESTTANVGTIKGGQATNVIAASVEITGECRSLLSARVEQVRDEMDVAMRSAAAEHGGSVEIEWRTEYTGFVLSDDDESVGLVAQACRDIGLEPRTFTTGGGSDANVISATGVPTVALSCGMAGVHGTSEQIAVADIVSLTDLCIAVARRVAERGGVRP